MGLERGSVGKPGKQELATCPRCNGTGKASDSEPCGRCKGTDSASRRNRDILRIGHPSNQRILRRWRDCYTKLSSIPEVSTGYGGYHADNS
jgi:hypothetical protein